MREPEPSFRPGRGNKWFIVARSLLKFTYGKCLHRKKSCLGGPGGGGAGQETPRGWSLALGRAGDGGLGWQGAARTLAGSNWIYFLVFRADRRGRGAA